MEFDGSQRGMLNLDEDRIRGRRILEELEAGRRRWESLEPSEQRWPLALTLLDRLLRRARALRFSNPEEMVSFAEAACAMSEALPAERYGDLLVNDLRARAWAEFGNALRVADELPRAGEALARARELAARGTGSFPLYARMSELLASLLTDLRRFEEAVDLLHSLANAYHKRERAGAVVRVLVQLGHVWTQANQPKLAIAAHIRALDGLRPGDRLFLPVVHTMALNFVEIGRAEVADTMIKRHQGLYRRSGKLNKFRLLWLEGKIAFALDQFGKAEGKLQSARLAFLRVKNIYEAAMVSLDLALLLARQERRKELTWLIKQMLETFRSLGIARETLATLTLLRRSVEDWRSVEHLCGQIEALARLMPELRPRSPKK